MADGWFLGLVVAMVILAGCAGPFGPGEPTPTPTATTPGPTASATASPTDTPTPDDGPPAGVSANGIENASALLVAHTKAVTATGYVISGNGSGTILRQGFLVDVDTRQRNVVAENASTYRTHRDVAAGPYNRKRDAWANVSVQFARIVTNGETEFRRGPPKSTEKLAGRGLLLPYLRGGNYTLVENETVNGDKRFTLRATEVDNQTAVFEALPKDAEEITDFQATVVVDSHGRVQSVEATIGYVIGGRNAEQQMTYTLEETGNVTVNQPGWTATASNATSQG